MLLLLALGLSMDAFAVAMTNGIYYRRYSRAQMLATGLFFGVFQGLMPILGYMAGSTVSHLVEAADHYIALGLLGYLGGRMIRDGVMQLRCPDEFCPAAGFSYRRLLAQAVATSIDALAAGVALAALDARIFRASAIIAVTAFFCSLGGVAAGRRFGALFKSQAELLGGTLLVAIGIKIFLEHTLRGV